MQYIAVIIMRSKTYFAVCVEIDYGNLPLNRNS